MRNTSIGAAMFFWYHPYMGSTIVYVPSVDACILVLYLEPCSTVLTVPVHWRITSSGILGIDGRRQQMTWSVSMSI